MKLLRNLWHPLGRNSAAFPPARDGNALMTQRDNAASSDLRPRQCRDYSTGGCRKAEAGPLARSRTLPAGWRGLLRLVVRRVLGLLAALSISAFSPSVVSAVMA